MELSVGEYGKHLFETMTEKDSGLSHWESIRAEAEPLVRELIRLNNAMKGGGYSIVGYKDEKGKRLLSERQRIDKAQLKWWGTWAHDLKEGDLVWLVGYYDFEMYIGQNEPLTVTMTGKHIQVSHPYDRHASMNLKANDRVLKAPADWEQNEELYTSKKYWLEQADKLKI